MYLTKRGQKRLLNVAKALRDAAKNDELRKAFTMRFFAYDGNINVPGEDYKHPKCGTPACALGHFAARKDLQKKYHIVTRSKDAHLIGRVATGNNREINYDKKLADYFGMRETRPSNYYSDGSAAILGVLFGNEGCRNAKTPSDAADFIERYVEEHSR